MAGIGSGKAAAAAVVGIPAALLLYLRMKYPTLREDVKLIRRSLNHIKIVEDALAKNYTVLDCFEDQVARIPDHPFILFKHECHTYGQVDHQANKMAHFVGARGNLRAGETVAFLLPNSPMFIWNFLAFNKLGIATSFLNYNLKAHALLHCIKICEAKVVLCSEENVSSIQSIQEDLIKMGVEIWLLGYEDKIAPPGMTRVDTRRYPADPVQLCEARKNSTKDDTSMYIYTSGTTGLPKAVNITHGRLTKSSLVTFPLEFKPDDVIYTPLPIYHSAGFQMGVCSAIRFGCTVALAPKFSASHYWDDVRRHGATVVQYIGELCRYLLAQPRRLEDGKYAHKVRIAIGNGLRPDIWAEFKSRFNVENIHEFYAATEGTFFVMNMDNKLGTVGRYPQLIHDIKGIAEIIKCDLGTAEPIRGKDGCCIRQPRGDMGLLVTRIDDFFTFEGYKATKETNEKKIVHDVVKKGDKFFNTGDLMMIDKDGYVYFCDRLGDTFRWKGENVATTEVAEELNRYPGVLETNVYGVQIPGHDGRAGMAAITLKQGASLDFQQFYQYVTENLPLYSCPKFLRLVPQMVITGTFKHKKTDLVKEGYDPAVVTDPLYFMDVGLKEIQDDLQKLGIEIWIIGHDDTAPPSGMMFVDTSKSCSDPVPKELRKNVTMTDPAGYMYTSGTTGLPKAVMLKNERWTKAMFLAFPCNITQDDVIYCALPLYHGSGFGFGVLSAIRTGCSIVIAPKFSASRFWDDVRRYRATVVQYIGELCRYVVAQPPSDKDGKYEHRVRAAIGNGLRPDIWAEFKNRFNIEHIYEFYAATEGNFLSMNMDGKEGSVGRYPKLVHDLVGNAEIIKCDLGTAEPIRDTSGYCIPVPTGETGLLVSKITKLFSFDGYKAPKETNEKKILRNVRKKGDEYFNTGDLMMLDSTGHLYFCDRLGDTFRWKGENVATTEVAAQINKYPGIEDTNVYGVKVPGQDGRAGMAAITLKKDSDNLNLEQLYQHVKENLPMYACPKFVRILPEVILTGTFKHKKADLVKEGFDPSVISDTLYFMDVGKETYVPLDQKVYQSIIDGLARL